MGRVETGAHARMGLREVWKRFAMEAEWTDPITEARFGFARKVPGCRLSIFFLCSMGMDPFTSPVFVSGKLTCEEEP